MKNKFFLIFSLFTFLACTRNYESATPKDLINQKEIETLLVDIYILEAATRTCTLNNQTDSLTLWVSQQVNALLKEKKITYQQFLNSYSYYMGHEKSAQEIMENVVNCLIKMETTSILNVQKLHKKDTTANLKNIVDDIISVKAKK